MSASPAAVIFCNNDLTDNVKNALIRQLFIHEVIDGYEFDNRVTADPNYVTTIHLNNIRLLVIRSFRELTNRALADVAIFVKAGLASVEQNKFGPPRRTFSIDKLHWDQIIG